MAEDKTHKKTDERAVGDATPTPEVAEGQRAGNWPRPGDEGYVNPDGTPQSEQQLADNRRAAADRAAAGSTVHGAPAATPGPQVNEAAEAAARRAETYGGPTVDDRDQALTKFVDDKSREAAEDAGSSPADAPRSAKPAGGDRSADVKPGEHR